MLAIVIFLIAGEVGTRLLISFEKEPEKLPPFNTAVKDEMLGWKCKENYAWQGDMKDAEGQVYQVNLNFQEQGFRYFEKNINPEKPTLLLVGDSFTQAVEVSDDKTFFQIWKDKLKINLYVYGMAGFGTYQELMILEQYVDQLDPDMVLLQFCSNDFIDNYWELEKESSYQVGLRRPYLKENQNTVYKVPLTFWKKLWNWSCFYRFIIQSLGNPIERNKKTAEHKIGTMGLDYPAFKTSVAMTKNILKKAKAIVGEDRRFYLMIADAFSPQIDELRKICKELDIWLMESNIHRLNEAKKNGEILHSWDNFHWNERGHEIVGKALKEDIGMAIEYQVK